MSRLDDIQKYAGLFFGPSDIAYLIDEDSELLIESINDESTDEHRAYMKGMLESEAKLRQEIVEMAQAGSPKAQEELLKIISKLKQTLI